MLKPTPKKQKKAESARALITELTSLLKKTGRKIRFYSF